MVHPRNVLHATLAPLVLAAAPLALHSQNATAIARGEATIAEALPALERPAGLAVRDIALADALVRLYESSGVPISFSPSMVPGELPVGCPCEDLSVAGALDRMLNGTGLRYRAIEGHVIVYRVLESELRQIVQPSATHYASLGPLPVVGMIEPQIRRQEPGVIMGRVTAAESGESLASVQVSVDGAGRTLTDNDGRFRIARVEPGRRMVSVSSIGYRQATREVEVGDGATVVVDFALEVSPTRLADLVVTATGDQRRVELGHVVGKIDAASVVANSVMPSLSDLITGRVPGVQVGASSFTGGSPEIRIRGVHSFSSPSEPLIIVDGVRIEHSGRTAYGGTSLAAGADLRQYGIDGTRSSGFGQTGGRLNDLTPNEIESIEVIKGPSAATLYGTDAANGVMVITTKRGRPGTPQWRVYTELGRVTLATRFLDNYRSWGRDAGGNVRQCRLLDVVQEICTGVDSLTIFNPLHDPSTSPLHPGSRQQVGANVTGGIGELSYFISAERESETGILRMPTEEEARVRAERGGAPLPREQVRPNWAEKLAFRTNLGLPLRSNLEVNVSQGLVLRETAIPGEGIFSAGEFGAGYRDANDGWRGLNRPGELFSVRNTERLTRSISSLTLNWRPSTWFNGRAVFGADISNSFLDALQRRDEGPLGVNRNGRRENTRHNTSMYSGDIGASLLFDVRPDLTSRTSVGVQYNSRTAQRTTVLARELAPGSASVTGAVTVDGSEANQDAIVAGAYVEQMMGLHDRLFLTAAVRFDGASAFGREFKTAMYPKASVSWLPLQRRDGLVNEVRLRAAYGAAGVQPGSLDALALMSATTAMVDGVVATAARLSAIGNPNLKPERQSEFEAGIDLELYGGRGRFEGSYYNRLSSDALIAVPLPSEIGIRERWENIGALRNSGWEGLLWGQPLNRPWISWDVTLNGSINRNEIEELGLDVPFLGSSLIRHQEGYPLSSPFSRPILSYQDTDGNGVIERHEVVVADEEEYLGPSFPPYSMSIGTGLTLLSQVRLSTLFDYRGGHVILNTAEINRCAVGNCRAINDPNAPLFEQARYVAFFFPGATTPAFNYSGFYEDGSFVRWRELAVTYQLPRPLVEWVRARSGNLTVSGRNLALLTRYRGKDPEVLSGPGLFSNLGAAAYADNPTQPPSRYWSVRFTLDF